jgi:hypothetical protein
VAVLGVAVDPVEEVGLRRLEAELLTALVVVPIQAPAAAPLQVVAAVLLLAPVAVTLQAPAAAPIQVVAAVLPLAPAAVRLQAPAAAPIQALRACRVIARMRTCRTVAGMRAVAAQTFSVRASTASLACRTAMTSVVDPPLAVAAMAARVALTAPPPR